MATLAKSRALAHHGLVAGVVVAVGGDQRGSLLRSLGEDDNCVMVVHSQSILTVFCSCFVYGAKTVYIRMYVLYISTKNR